MPFCFHNYKVATLFVQLMCRSLKKARANTKREATLLTNQPKHRIKPDDEIHGDVSTAGHGEPVSPRSVQRPASGVGTNQNVPRDRKELAKEDLKLHVGGGNVMSYRWVIRSVARPNHSGNVLEAMEALSTSQEAMGFPPTQHETFLLVAMPGLFMTLDSMERTLGGLLEHNPRGKLLLVSVFQEFYIRMPREIRGVVECMLRGTYP